MSDQLSDQLSDQPSGEAPQDLKSPHLSDEGSWRSLSLAWDELRRRALLGEGLTSELGSQAAPPLDELSPESWRELALSVALRRTLPPPLRAPLEGVEAPEQTGPYPEEVEVLMSWLNTKEGSPGWGKRPKKSEQRVTVALSAYLCALAHKRHQLPVRLIAPVMSRLLKGHTPASLERALLLPLSAFLQAIGPRGRWLLERAPGGEGLLQDASHDSRAPQAPQAPQELLSRLADLERLCDELTLALERVEGASSAQISPKRNAQRAPIKNAQRRLIGSLINLRPPELEDALAAQPLQALLSAYPSLQTEALLELKRLLSSGQLISLWREA